VASTALRLLLDASVTEPLATYIAKLVPSAILSRQALGQSAKDPRIAEFANTERRTIVAIDSDFKHYQVKYGVIKINGPDRADDDCLFEIFRTFWKSGLRGKGRSRRTFLNREGVRITNGEVIERRWHPKPCVKAKRSIRLIAAPRPK
jgi:Domain of unknown function (DUF5615)